MKNRLIPALAILLVATSLSAQVSVRVENLEAVLVDLERRAPAQVEPLNDARLAAEVSAVVSAVHADVGQQVSQGDVLLELDARDYQLSVYQAQAMLESSKARKASADLKLSRAENLVKDQYLSDDTLLDRQTEVAVLRSEIRANEVALSMAQRNLEKCTIRAPFDGAVIERNAQIGSFVSPGSPLLHLVQTDRFEVDAEIPANVAYSLGESSNIRFESRSQHWEVELLRLSPVVERSRRSQRARLAFTGEAPTVGRSGEIVWRVEDGLLPSNLVSRREGSLGVFVHNQGTAEFIPLPQAQEGRPVVVDLPKNTQIITLGRDRLQPGDAVTPTGN